MYTEHYLQVDNITFSPTKKLKQQIPRANENHTKLYYKMNRKYSLQFTMHESKNNNNNKLILLIKISYNH